MNINLKRKSRTLIALQRCQNMKKFSTFLDPTNAIIKKCP